MAINEHGIRENLAKYHSQKITPARCQGMGGETGQITILLTKSRPWRLRWSAGEGAYYGRYARCENMHTLQGRYPASHAARGRALSCPRSTMGNTRRGSPHRADFPISQFSRSVC